MDEFIQRPMVGSDYINRIDEVSICVGWGGNEISIISTQMGSSNFIALNPARALTLACDLLVAADRLGASSPDPHNPSLSPTEGQTFSRVAVEQLGRLFEEPILAAVLRELARRS